MKFGKILTVGAAAFAMIIGTVGCYTDDDIEMFKVKPGEQDGKNGKGGTVV